MRFRFSRQAESDIEEIGDFVARDNPACAVSYIEELRARCPQLRKAFRNRRWIASLRSQ